MKGWTHLNACKGWNLGLVGLVLIGASNTCVVESSLTVILWSCSATTSVAELQGAGMLQILLFDLSKTFGNSDLKYTQHNTGKNQIRRQGVGSVRSVKPFYCLFVPFYRSRCDEVSPGRSCSCSSESYRYSVSLRLQKHFLAQNERANKDYDRMN